MSGKKGRSGRLTKIEENYGENLGIRGMKLLTEHVNDPMVSRIEKLTVLQPYLVKMIPTMIEIDKQSITQEERLAILTIAKSIASFSIAAE